MIARTIAFLGFLASSTALAVTDSEVEKLLNMPLSSPAAADVPQAGGAPQSSTPPLDCLLTPSVDASIASPVVGVIEKVFVQRGDIVRKGDVLVTLRSEVEQATLDLNRAQTDYGKRTIERNIGLYQRKLISEQEKDEIIMNNRLYGFEMAQTQAVLDQKTIRSPINGVVVDTFADPGEYVGEDALLQIAQLDPLYVEAVLPARYLGQISSGDEAQIKLNEPLNSSYTAEVKIVDRVLDAASGTFGVRLELANGSYKLPAGMKCTISFE